MVDVTNPRVWLKAFWGFDPRNEGYLGFSRSGDRDSFIERARPGDLVLIYGASSDNTSFDERKQALGFLLVDLDLIRDIDRLSPAALLRKQANIYRDRWTFAVPVRRAWKLKRQVQVRQIAPDTYLPNRSRVLASRGDLLTLGEALRALELPVYEINVFGEPLIIENEADERNIAKVFKPSCGLTPTFGPRDSDYADGDTYLYMLQASENIAAILGRDFAAGMAGKIMVKVGFSSDPNRRCNEHNSTLPPASTFRWKSIHKSKAYADGLAAKLAEDLLKSSFDKKFESLGGEFFLGNPEDMRSAFFDVPGAANIVKSTLMPRRKL